MLVDEINDFMEVMLDKGELNILDCLELGSNVIEGRILILWTDILIECSISKRYPYLLF